MSVMSQYVADISLCFYVYVITIPIYACKSIYLYTSISGISRGWGRDHGGSRYIYSIDPYKI